jgi:Na+/H+ antiporter NhaB
MVDSRAEWCYTVFNLTKIGAKMKLFIAGFITCFIIMTIGFSGLGKLGDNLMNKGQAVVKEASK